MQRLTVETSSREQFVDITGDIRRAVAELGLDEGAVLVYSPHTTAGITVNEGYDPDVAADVQDWLRDRIPHRDGYAHAEGNSDSHIKAILTGGGQLLPVAGGELALGRWQAVFFCEFDGPRHREVWVTAVG
ncbi:MAG TPA: secondary thiamine-phosphate synthase enzyme YjbQ [Gaiellales bacterium]|nr:secondary thiamine-phosphate synthase enzyme YjbQ [Gaiellales bacterium]